MNIKESLDKIEGFFSPKVIAEINDVYVKVAKIKGEEIPWHSHEKEDEFFYILEGELLMEIEGKENFRLSTGDFYVVKRGVLHRISAKNECKIMLIENKTTAHTGQVMSKVTKSIEDQLK